MDVDVVLAPRELVLRRWLELVQDAGHNREAILINFLGNLGSAWVPSGDSSLVAEHRKEVALAGPLLRLGVTVLAKDQNSARAEVLFLIDQRLALDSLRKPQRAHFVPQLIE